MSRFSYLPAGCTSSQPKPRGAIPRPQPSLRAELEASRRAAPVRSQSRDCGRWIARFCERDGAGRLGARSKKKHGPRPALTTLRRRLLVLGREARVESLALGRHVAQQRVGAEALAIGFGEAIAFLDELLDADFQIHVRAHAA